MKMERWIYEGTLMAVWDIPTGSVTVELAFLEQEANHPLCTKFVISQWQLIVHFYIWKKNIRPFPQYAVGDKYHTYHVQK